VDSQIVAAGLLSAAVVVSVLAIGAVHLPVLLVVAALAFGAAAVALHRHALGQDGLVIPLPALICAGLAAYTLLQIIPLPMRVLEAVAPTAADIWQRCLLPFGEHGPRWASLSLDPGASAVEALKWAVYGAVFVAAATVSSRYGAGWGLVIVFGAAAAAALTTLGHGLADAEKVYGLYQPEFPVVSWHVGPLLNPNNLAGYLNLGALCGLGLMLGERPHLPRWLIGAGVALIVGIELTAASRGGVVTLLAGVVALALFTRRRDAERRGARRATSTWMLLLAVAGGTVLAVLGGTEKTWTELYDKDLSKLSMVLWVKPLLRDHPIFGIGRGAFESVFPVYRTVPGNYVYTHAENFVVQWAAEWGVPVALVALVTFGWAFGPRRLGVLRSSVAAGAWCGAGALLVHNLVDLGLEIPAVSIAAAATLGSLWGDRHRARAREGLRRPGPFTPERAQAVARGTGAVGATLAIVALALGLHDVDADRLAARDAAAAGGDGAAARRLLHQAMLRHPAEPYLPLVGAMLAFRGHHESPIPWLQRSLERAQINGRAHLLLAEVLASRGSRKQALFELRLAVGDDHTLTSAASVLAARWAQDFDDLLTSVPEGKPGAQMLSSMAAVLRSAEKSALDLGRRCDREAIQRDPDLVDPRLREASERIDAMAARNGGAGASLCVDRAACRARVLEHAEVIARLMPSSSSAATLRARLLVAEDRAEEAVKLLLNACEQATDRVACLQARAAAASRVKAPGLLDAATKDLLTTVCVSSLPCAEMTTWLAQLRLERGEPNVALGLLVRAAREDPGNEGRWLGLANAASRAGQHAQALEALMKVANRRGGADPALQKLIDAERAQTIGGLLPPPR
jgi:hypothetical protein